MWEVSWQDFRRHEFGDPMPPIERETFETKEAAERRKDALKSGRVVACVTPAMIIKREKRADPPVFAEGWKLAE